MPCDSANATPVTKKASSSGASRHCSQIVLSHVRRCVRRVPPIRRRYEFDYLSASTEPTAATCCDCSTKCNSTRGARKRENTRQGRGPHLERGKGVED
jgi:hypothetical protein